MQHLMEAWTEIEPRVARAGAIAVGADFDGTLAPLQDRPETVFLSAPGRAVIEHLGTTPGVTLAVVSGRALADLEARLGLPWAIAIGNHGFEIHLPGRPFGLACGSADLEAVRAAARALDAAIRGIPGVWLENKGPTFALHYRETPPAEAPRFLRAVRAEVAALPRSVRVTEGKHVIEIRPAVDGVDKGRAFLDALAEAGVPSDAMLWFFGDDVTDEDVFTAMRPDAITVHVGSSDDVSAARYVAASPDEVLDALDRIVACRTRRT